LNVYYGKLKLQTPYQFEENYMAGIASNC
jgi:hypothetical protein